MTNKLQSDILGWTFRDKITGLEGVAIAIQKWITGCERVVIQPPITGGVLPDHHYIDTSRLERLGNKPIVIETDIETRLVELNDYQEASWRLKSHCEKIYKKASEIYDKIEAENTKNNK